MARVLVTGATGQDGWFLARSLLLGGDEVHGLARRPGDVPPGMVLHLGDVGDRARIDHLVGELLPDEVYHLAAESFVPSATDDAIVSHQVDAVDHLLHAVGRHVAGARVVVAGSSEVFAGAADSPQDENCPPAPRTPYGRAKAAVMARVREWRATTGGLGGVAILYTHESERRAPRFLGRKVSLGVARIVRGMDESLVLGNLEARRDWGYAPDFVDAVVRMARRAPGEDFVIGTGVSRSVAEFCAAAFRVVGLDWRAYVRSDPALVRAVDPVTLLADPGRAAARLGWRATTPFEEMIRRMVEADLARVSAA